MTKLQRERDGKNKAERERERRKEERVNWEKAEMDSREKGRQE